MPETIKASEQNVVRIFSNDYLFEIPVFQRPYAWTKDQVDDLLDDLLFAMRRENAEPYFLGSIVLIKDDGADSQVVDGQQRLTTLTMLLCVLRELAEDEAVRSALDTRIRQQSDVLTGTKEVVRLGLRLQDREFFYDNVQNGGGVAHLLANSPARETDSQERIFENVKHLYKELTTLSAEERTQLAQFVVQYCYLVVVSTSDMSSAYRIFSVMNDRGLNLSPTDILKAEIIGTIAGTEDQETYARKWEDIEQELGRERFGALFAHIRTIYTKAKQRRSLQEEFREQVLNNRAPTDFIDRILDQYDDAYKSVLGLPGGSATITTQVDICLGHLRRLDNVDWIPLAMAFFYRNPNDRSGIESFIKDLERLAYGLFIRRANINERINRYAAVLRAIENGDDVRQENNALQLQSGEKTEILNVLGGSIYTLPRVPQPLLLRLDSLLADTGATYDHSIISVEHVLPQNPGNDSKWRRWYPDDTVRAKWMHRLANLVLLSRRKNTRASNWEFERKKKEYFQPGNITPFALTTEVLGETQWTEAVLERRQKRLVDKLKTEWRLD